MSILFFPPRFKATDLANVPIPGAFLSFYATGTSTLQPIWANVGLSVQLPNPIKADANGLFPVIFLDDSLLAYKVVFQYPDVDNPSIPGALFPEGTVDPYNVRLAGLPPQFPITEAEAGLPIADLAYPPGDVRRYGILANSALYAEANTVALRSLLDPNIPGGYTGRVFWPNLTGVDKYHFNNIINSRDGIDWDGNNCTFRFSKVAQATDTGSGFIWAIRDFNIYNAYIEIDYDMAGISTGAGYAIKFGGRGDDNVTYRPGLWDSLLSAPMGNCHARNVHITSNVTAESGGAIALTGGLKNVTLDVSVDGQGVLKQPVVYEFGWATSGTTNLRQTSHMSDFNFRIRVTDYDPTTGVAVTLAGAYGGEVYLEARDGGSFLNATTGESMNYRPWVGVDDLAKSSPIKISGVGLNMMAGGMTLTGHYNASGGYLSAIIGALSSDNQEIAQRDLATYEIGDLTLYGNQVGYGIVTSARYIKTGIVRIRRFTRGMYLLDECTRFDLDGLTILECTQTGLGLNGGSSMSTPIRQKVGTIRNAFIAGNSTSAAGSFPGLEIGNSANVRVSSSRFNYEAAYDNADETTQGNACQLAATAAGVVFDGCHVGALVGGTYAYSNATVTPANGNTVLNATGSITQNRAWLNLYAGVDPTSAGDADKTLTVGSSYRTTIWAATLTANHTATLSTTGAKQGDEFIVVRTGLGSFTLNVGGLKTIPSATAAFVRVGYDGSAWKLTGYGLL